VSPDLKGGGHIEVRVGHMSLMRGGGWGSKYNGVDTTLKGELLIRAAGLASCHIWHTQTHMCVHGADNFPAKPRTHTAWRLRFKFTDSMMSDARGGGVIGGKERDSTTSCCWHSELCLRLRLLLLFMCCMCVLLQASGLCARVSVLRSTTWHCSAGRTR